MPHLPRIPPHQKGQRLAAVHARDSRSGRRRLRRHPSRIVDVDRGANGTRIKGIAMTHTRTLRTERRPANVTAAKAAPELHLGAALRRHAPAGALSQGERSGQGPSKHDRQGATLVGGSRSAMRSRPVAKAVAEAWSDLATRIPARVSVALLWYCIETVGGAWMSTQWQAWVSHWHLAPADVLESPLTAKDTGGPTTKAAKALFPTIFNGLDTKLYGNRYKNASLTSAETDQIARAIGERNELIGYAADCFVQARRVYRELIGAEDEQQDTTLKAARAALIITPHLSGDALTEAVAQVIRASMGLVPDDDETPYTPQAFAAAARSGDLVQRTEGLLAEVWATRADARPAEFASGLQVALSLPLDAHGRWDLEVASEEDRRRFEEDWEHFEDAVAQLDNENLDHQLRMLGLADEALSAGVEDEDVCLLQPMVLGGIMKPDVPVLDNSIQARLGLFHRSSRGGLGPLDQVINQVVTAAARPLGLSTRQARLIVLLGWAIGTVVGDLHQASDRDSHPGVAPVCDIFAARYRLLANQSSGFRTMRRIAREESASESYACLIWVRAGALEFVGQVPEEPSDVWAALAKAWFTWSNRTLRDDKDVRTGKSRLVHIVDSFDNPSETSEVLRDRLSLDTRESKTPSLDLGRTGLCLEKLFEELPAETRQFAELVASSSASDKDVKNQFDWLCRTFEAKVSGEHHWCGVADVIAFIRTHLRRS